MKYAEKNDPRETPKDDPRDKNGLETLSSVRRALEKESAEYDGSIQALQTRQGRISKSGIGQRLTRSQDRLGKRRREVALGLAAYDVTAHGTGWTAHHDGTDEGVYETKEAAFEAAISAASLAIRQGHEVRVTAPRSDARI